MDNRTLCSFVGKLDVVGTSLVAQWLRLHTPNIGDPGSIPGQGTRSHVLQLGVHMPQRKILHAAMKISHDATKIWHGQRNKYLKKIRKRFNSGLALPGIHSFWSWESKSALEEEVHSHQFAEFPPSSWHCSSLSCGLCYWPGPWRSMDFQSLV